MGEETSEPTGHNPSKRTVTREEDTKKKGMGWKEFAEIESKEARVRADEEGRWRFLKRSLSNLATP